MKMTISVSDELAKRVEEYAERNYTSKSAVFAQGANSLLLQESLSHYMSEIAIAFKKIADNNVLDEESEKKLNEFMSVATLLVQK